MGVIKGDTRSLDDGSYYIPKHVTGTERKKFKCSTGSNINSRV